MNATYRMLLIVATMLAWFVPTAHARWYDPATGRWMTRDPLGTGTMTWSATNVLAGTSKIRTTRQVDPLAQYDDGSNLYLYALGSPTTWTDPLGLKVQICKRNTNFGNVADDVGEAIGAKHWWIKTDTVERGLGTYGGGVPGQPGDEGGEAGAASPYRTETGWNDHTGQSEMPGARCTTLTGCDEECVNRKICDTNPQGTWKYMCNDCNTNVRDVLKECGCDRPCIRWKNIKSLVPGKRHKTIARRCAEYAY